jgi:hypothetical protein
MDDFYGRIPARNTSLATLATPALESWLVVK